jgi:transposase
MKPRFINGLRGKRGEAGCLSRT